MEKWDYRDIFAGALLIALGLFVGFYSTAKYDIGTLSRMGTGMFPMMLGYILAGFGVVVLVSALFRSGPLPKINLRSFLAVIASLAAFALTSAFGMVPAIFALTAVCALTDERLGLISGAILAVVLSIMAGLIFRIGLGLQLYLFVWPF